MRPLPRRCRLIPPLPVEFARCHLDIEPVRCTIVDHEDLDAEARLHGAKIGYVNCIRDDDRLKICDLRVDEAQRGRGIGRQLLQLVLQAADCAGVREVWGLVTDGDLARFPGLTGWYERLGFAINDADSADKSDVPDAVKRIVRRRG